MALTLSLAALAAAPAMPIDATWPQFRGHAGRAVSAIDTLPIAWSTTTSVAWKTDVPGRGWSSPIVWGSRVFLTTVVNQAAAKEPEQGFYRPLDVSTPEGDHEWTVLCLDADSGRTLWQRVGR